MKFLILSDIHGSVPALDAVLPFFHEQAYDMLLLLGDILNYGPRNGLPDGLDAPGVVERLKPLAPHIVAVRGNCDSEVDQMLLPFPIMGTYTLVCDGKHRIFLTHGHVFNPDNMPAAPAIDLFLYGHTHLPHITAAADNRPAVCNCGSPTFPKGGNPPTFATLDDGILRLRHLDGSIIEERALW